MKTPFHSSPPAHWFKPVHAAKDELETEPVAIEYLKAWTGETFIHTGGTAYWHTDEDGLGWMDIDALIRSGITHWRMPRMEALPPG